MSNPLMQMMGGNNPMNAMMQNNPIMQLVQMMKSGQTNSQQLAQQIMSQNPQMQQIANSMQGKSQNEINEYIKSASQQKGIDLAQLAKSIGMPKDVAEKFGINID